MVLPDPDDIAAIEGIGLSAIRLLDEAHGPGTAADAVRSALRLSPSATMLADAPEEDPLAGNGTGGANRIVAYSLGSTLVELARATPADQPEKLKKIFTPKGH